MRTISLNKKDIHKGNLVLINKRYPLLNKEEEHQIKLVPASIENPQILLEIKTATVLTHLIGILKGQKNILPVSGYRSYEEQSKIYVDSLFQHGREFTEQYVAMPNHSEHQTGLAIDLAINREEIDFIRPEFPYEGICNLFREKAPIHGFVERYRKGKEKVTGIAHEPWHFRYVGYPHSLLMKKYDLVLEEYVEFLKAYPYEGNHLITELNQQTVEIFHVNANSSSNFTTIELPEDSIYQLSGNNIDGFIVTLWR
jgi:D-alanyl-D-alanine dipeptidase/carboxypeptidase